MGHEDDDKDVMQLALFLVCKPESLLWDDKGCVLVFSCWCTHMF